MSAEYWFMFPVSIQVAAIAMAAGIAGTSLFSPIIILGLGLPPDIAIATGLITEVFGFASGFIAYYRKRLIDIPFGLTLIVVTVPLAIIGVVVGSLLVATVLKIILGMGLIAVASSFLRAPEPKDVVRMDKNIDEEYGGEKGETCLTTADGVEICYTVCNKNDGRIIAGVGAFFEGMTSTGLGELNGYFLMRRCRVPSSVAVATSVFVVAVTALAAATGQVVKFAQIGGEGLGLVLSLVIFTVPGVIVGGQLGASVSASIPQPVLERALGVLFLIIAALTLGEAIL